MGRVDGEGLVVGIPGSGGLETSYIGSVTLLRVSVCVQEGTRGHTSSVCA